MTALVWCLAMLLIVGLVLTFTVSPWFILLSLVSFLALYAG